MRKEIFLNVVTFVLWHILENPFSNKAVFHFTVCTDKNTAFTGFDEQWHGLNLALCRDIFGVHKVFIFGTFNCTQYTFDEFLVDVRFAEQKIFGNAICTPHFVPRENIKMMRGATLFPNWLIRDNLFEVLRYHFAVSQWINRLKCKDIDVELDVISCVIPRNVVSLYDHDIAYQHSIDDIIEYLSGTSVEVIHHSEITAGGRDVLDIFRFVDESIKSTDLQNSKTIVFIIDRRASTETGNDSYFVLRCDSMESVGELTTNHFIGLHFKLNVEINDDNDCDRDSNKIVKCWLRYGNRQCLRFWPEQLVWFIPRLFVKGKWSGYGLAKRLHSDDYKHGFCVDLKDPVFDRYYKILTSWTHQSVNYHRSKWTKNQGKRFGFRDYVESKMHTQSAMELSDMFKQNEYSSDDILYDISGSDIPQHSNIRTMMKSDDLIIDLIHYVELYQKQPESHCTIEHPLELWQCHHVEEMITDLIAFESEHFEVNAANFNLFDESAVIRGLDHLAEVHNVFSIENKKRIRSYFKTQVDCSLGSKCAALKIHCSRKRELDEGTLAEEAETDEIDSILVVVKSALSSAHCYLLHSDDALYRTSGQSAKFEINPFSTPVVTPTKKEKQEQASAPPSIDFGVHVLQWLPYGVKPRFGSFEEEMVGNPASTLSPQLLEQHRVECAAKMDGIQWTEDNFDELLCLKLYTDCTNLQNLFRRAYWKGSSLETKRSFYQWAIKMYQTFLFHAQPIPKTKNGPITLYHGLNRLFQVCYYYYI